jgi:hypothetical protein
VPERLACRQWVKSVALFNRRLPVNFRYAPLAPKTARRGEASEIAKAIPRNRAKFELSRKADLLSSINAGQTTARRAGL